MKICKICLFPVLLFVCSILFSACQSGKAKTLDEIARAERIKSNEKSFRSLPIYVQKRIAEKGRVVLNDTKEIVWLCYGEPTIKRQLPETKLLAEEWIYQEKIENRKKMQTYEPNVLTVFVDGDNDEIDEKMFIDYVSNPSHDYSIHENHRVLFNGNDVISTDSILTN